MASDPTLPAGDPLHRRKTSTCQLKAAGGNPATTAQQAAQRLQDTMFDAARAARSIEHHDAWVSLVTQAEDALQAMWNHFGDLSDNDMLGMPCKGALVKCRSALAAIRKAKDGR